VVVGRHAEDALGLGCREAASGGRYRVLSSNIKLGRFVGVVENAASGWEEKQGQKKVSVFFWWEA
jgi:hypothetical protein